MARTPAPIIYRVKGRGAFPIDMLRYDGAVPASEEDSAIIQSTFHPRNREDHVVRVRATKEPTDGRWESFGWTVRRD